jgi:hypothetical protein
MTTCTRNAHAALRTAWTLAEGSTTPDAWEAATDAAMDAADAARLDRDHAREVAALNLAALATTNAAHARQEVAA